MCPARVEPALHGLKVRCIADMLRARIMVVCMLFVFVYVSFYPPVLHYSIRIRTGILGAKIPWATITPYCIKLRLVELNHSF